MINVKKMVVDMVQNRLFGCVVPVNSDGYELNCVLTIDGKPFVPSSNGYSTVLSEISDSYGKYTVNCTIENDGSVTLNFPEDTFAKNARFDGELILVNDNGKVLSMGYKIIVRPVDIY